METAKLLREKEYHEESWWWLSLKLSKRQLLPSTNWSLPQYIVSHPIDKEKVWGDGKTAGTYPRATTAIKRLKIHYIINCGFSCVTSKQCKTQTVTLNRTEQIMCFQPLFYRYLIVLYLFIYSFLSVVLLISLIFSTFFFNLLTNEIIK